MTADRMRAGRHRNDREGSRHDLTGEHRLTDAGQLILAVLFFGVWITDGLILRSTTVLNAYVPLALRIPLGVCVLVLSGYLARAGLGIVFGEIREPPQVIRTGVFGWVRHPIYLSEILLYLGLLVVSLSLASVAVWLAAIGFLHYVSRHEERLLLAQYGAAYEEYMREVPMWIPWPKRSAKR